MRPNKMTWLAVAALLAAAPAFAQTAQTNMSGLKLSGDKPIQIESDKLEVRQDQVFAPIYLRGRAQGIRAVEVAS